ncbi:ABC1 kinase family protein [Candidatus Thiodiazotropha sp. CDECU1]|uniref:ABC1 kinase family protein n=1 Tax=Candidatus Thiodiazotropha sp. CDECU1 TaxID=3065865 RepID=UPI002930443B|nr:AarF/ABC1/UbiB kinase family protein [Candidatus Thiodiazotropha sp. CDECU1]
MGDSIPSGKFARSSIAGSAILKAGSRRLTHAAKRPFLSESVRLDRQQQLDEETARILFEAFSRLRGSALKIAQMLSMESNLMPDWFRQEMGKSYHQVPPLGRPLIRKLILQEFNKPPEDLFTRFDPNAFAAASLGQVHAAVGSQDQDLAVKLQYPGIDVTIESDLQLLRSIIRRTRYAKLLLSSIDEIEQRLHEEVDYLHEAENTEWFKSRLQLPGVIIPAVYKDYSSKRILTTERLRGLHLEAWLGTDPSQQARDHFGQRLYDIFVNSFYGLHALHADPNPGNYLFAKDGTLGLLDFGCVRYYSSDFVNLIPVLLHAYMERNAEKVISTYQQLGMVAEMSGDEQQSFYDQVLQPFGDWLTKPFKAGRFDFTNQQASYTAEGWAAFKQLSKVHKINDLANEFIYFDRTFFGLYQIFEQMGACIEMEHQWLH